MLLIYYKGTSPVLGILGSWIAGAQFQIVYAGIFPYLVNIYSPGSFLSRYSLVNRTSSIFSSWTNLVPDFLEELS